MKKSPTIAFIAKYAPINDSTSPINTDKENEVYSKYHFDIYSVLKNNFSHVITGCDANYIMENHNKIDYIFSLLNRAPYRNSEVFVSSLAEYYGIPYLGARPNIRALAEDKHLAKIMASYCGISTPHWITFDVGEQPQNIKAFMGPYFVKPRYGASSKNISEKSICYTWDDVIQRVDYLHSLREDVIVEKFIDGVYYSSPVIFTNGVAQVLPPIEEKSILTGNVVTYLQKRKVEGGLTRTVVTDTEIVDKIEYASKIISQMIQPIDYTRIDYIIEPNGTITFLEFNVCCNLGMQSAFVLSAKAAGMTYTQLIMTILNESFARQGLLRHD